MKIKTKRQKIIAGILGVVIVLLAICLLVLPRGSREESYRSIRVVELEGTVMIERESTGSLEAAVNMNLVSGDHISTEAEAYVVLRLDADKYVMLGESGSMEVIAEGSRSAGRTSIYLTAGSVLSEIRNPLGEDASFDIVTSGAAMSVRGTVFEVRRTEDGGDGETAVLVYDGKVVVELAGKESVLYEAGEYTKFTNRDTPEFLIEREIITDGQMDGQIFQRLQQIAEDGRRINLGMAQASGAGVKTQETTPPPEPTIVPEAVPTPETAATPEAEVSAEPSTAPVVTTPPAATATSRPAAGTVPAWTPRVTATPVPATPIPDDANDWEEEDDTEPEDTNTSEPTEEPEQPSVPVSTPEPDDEPTPVPGPTEEPGPIPGPTEEPGPDPGSGEEPGPDPGPTEEPGPDPGPTEEPGPDPGSTEEPGPDPGSGEEPSPDPGPGEEPSPDPGPGEEPSPDPGPGEESGSDSGPGGGTGP